MLPLLLLHGAIGAASQLVPLKDRLGASYDVYTFDFTGHGGRQGSDAPFSMEFFANDVLRFMEEKSLQKVSVFGYSMGGYVGMYLAKNHREKIDRVITLATKYQWDEAIAVKEVQMLNPEKIEQKLPAFAESLRKMHAPNDWKELLNKTAGMLTALGKDNTIKLGEYAEISVPALLLLGDRDKMVSLDETAAVYKSLPGAQLGVIPGTPHPIEQVDADVLAFLIRRFLK